MRSGLRPAHFEVLHDDGLESDEPLVRAAGPVLDELDADLANTGLGVVFTDAAGRVLDRRVSDRALHARLDRIMLAPGFVYAERQVGTNAIGTAIEERAPSMIRAGEHFADTLTTMTCAAAPVADPFSGNIIGIVDLSCAARHGTPLMLPLARQAAREVEQQLRGQVSTTERLLLEHFARERRRVKGPLILVGERTVLANTAAQRVIDPDDEPGLWDRVRKLAAESRASAEMPLTRGTFEVLGCQPILAGGEVIAFAVRLAPPGRGAARTVSGWTSLTETERGVADLVTAGLTNREVAEQLFMSPYTVDSHLRSIFRKLAVSSRVHLTRAALDRT